MSRWYETTSVDTLRDIITDSLLQEYLEYQRSSDETLTFGEWLAMAHTNLARKLGISRSQY